MVPNFDGMKGCFIVMAVLSVIGLVALAGFLWWFFSHISVAWGAP